MPDEEIEQEALTVHPIKKTVDILDLANAATLADLVELQKVSAAEPMIEPKQQAPEAESSDNGYEEETESFQSIDNCSEEPYETLAYKVNDLIDEIEAAFKATFDQTSPFRPDEIIPDKQIDARTLNPDEELTDNQIRNLDDFLGSRIADSPLSQCWEDALAQKSLLVESFDDVIKLVEEAKANADKDTDQLTNQTSEAYELAEKAYNGLRKAFWPKVYEEKDNVDFLKEDLGLKLTEEDIEKGRAPSLLMADGRKMKVTLEHFERKVDDPSEAIESANLLFSLSYENSVYLEHIRREERKKKD